MSRGERVASTKCGENIKLKFYGQIQLKGAKKAFPRMLRIKI